MNRVPVEPELLRWARERAGYRADALAGRFPKLQDWERGEVKPTLKQLEAFAKATRTPVGFFFLADPPVERMPIPGLPHSRQRAREAPEPRASGYRLSLPAAPGLVPRLRAVHA